MDERKSCKGCTERHMNCHKDCPTYAAMKEQNAAIAKAKKMERIGTYNAGCDKHCTSEAKYQLQRRSQNWCV